MAAAIALGRRGLGQCWPNPAVGCVIVRDSVTVGRGWTQPSGRPHAEVVALTQAGDEAQGATAYVTLEPCAHYGKTPPCCDALIAAGVKRVVVAIEDPDPRVNGRGIATLREAGVEVVVGVGAEQAGIDLAGFLNRVTANRPLFTWKTATSLDGRIALADGTSKWITEPAARAAGHALRASHDAILIGRGTAMADNPKLDTRLPGLSTRSPVRILLDSQLTTPADSKLGQTAKEQPLWIFHRSGADVGGWQETGAELIAADDLTPAVIAAELAAKGLTRVLIEGGGEVAASFLAADLIDHIEWFRAAKLIGGDGRAGLGSIDLEELAAAPRYKRHSVHTLGRDCWERYLRSRDEA
ncbi:MAG: bifunctional diaminohydroxyphosphoribosylaminopyrimidine deaminase/5-amino-6-(5-phosphoribosylamino)uracil reductase RibD [Alphaproteobacteria bacterium]|nr:bifunctional diaminohydroxyphosphoribosylaminopyrimidine deaminase/5-amino-6-(5-phosphoribosylamino)uracil reductase RibD [Alphaproteobacteria bacterium SS10]